MSCITRFLLPLKLHSYFEIKKLEGTNRLSESNLILAPFQEDLYFFLTLATFRLRGLEFYESLTHLCTVRPLFGFGVSWGKPFDSGHLFLVPSMVANITSEKFTEIQDQMSEVPPSLPFSEKWISANLFPVPSPKLYLSFL